MFGVVTLPRRASCFAPVNDFTADLGIRLKVVEFDEVCVEAALGQFPIRPVEVGDDLVLVRVIL